MDTDTGLIWQRCTLGQTGSDCSGGSASDYTWQEALQAGNSAPWRLPNMKELRSIVEEKCYDPAINLTVFPNTNFNTNFSSYWSGSPYASLSIAAWHVDFDGGLSGYNLKGYYAAVRLVRDGQ